MNNKNISKKIEVNESYIKEVLGDCSDIIYRRFIIPGLFNRKALLVYIDGLVNAADINDTILRPLISYSNLMGNGGFIVKPDPQLNLLEAGILTPAVRGAKDWIDIFDSLLSGSTAIFLDKTEDVIIADTPGWEARETSEPITESEVRAPKDGFVETLRSNTSFIRRRIKDLGLRFEDLYIGKRTKTKISLAYIEDLADKKILEELKKRLNRIEVDSILESGYLEEYIEDSPYSPFPQIEHTERPDKASAAILEGKIAILVDGTPFVLTVPTVFWQFIQASGDYYERYYLGTFLRMIRLFALFITLTISSIYVLTTAFHQAMLPTTLALRIAAGREGVPFPSIVEAILMEIMFEILREAGIRLPRPVGQAVSIVGALVVGEAAVNAGLVGPAIVVVVAIAGICSFAIPAYNMTTTFRLLRFPLLLLSGTLGILGFLAGLIAITLHLLSLRSFSVPYLAPINPLRGRGNKDTLVRVPWWNMTSRPYEAKGEVTQKQAKSNELKPNTPKQQRMWRKSRKKKGRKSSDKGN